ncbi:hypothetical protein MSG28_008229 [Choristoneura fumiferana]|uniref:Uncharacterized protein n=2 Tax=Choristoneura fumiferana TaxID=7141 RepID=A0ACC0JAV2_CHOFU|nr:hypothetical protein MSG28_008229 [Choristoneura fumiferana]KAI8421141.1 hypothetical protein MSG28_008229 [Choristoneura fumiferana]
MVVPATYIKLIRGTKLLYINEYTFFNSGGIGAGGFRYTCSSYLRRKCRAFAHVSRDDVILKMSNDHNHPPTKYMRTASGTRLLRINDYTYFKNCALRDGGSKYLCSSKISKQCKAYIHVSKDDIILKVGGTSFSSSMENSETFEVHLTENPGITNHPMSSDPGRRHLKRRPMSSAEKSRRFREKLKKERPEAFAAYRIKDRERAKRKRYRDKLKNVSKAQIKKEHYFEEILP